MFAATWVVALYLGGILHWLFVFQLGKIFAGYKESKKWALIILALVVLFSRMRGKEEEEGEGEAKTYY